MDLRVKIIRHILKEEFSFKNFPQSCQVRLAKVWSLSAIKNLFVVADGVRISSTPQLGSAGGRCAVCYAYPSCYKTEIATETKWKYFI